MIHSCIIYFVSAPVVIRQTTVEHFENNQTLSIELGTDNYQTRNKPQITPAVSQLLVEKIEWPLQAGNNNFKLFSWLDGSNKTVLRTRELADDVTTAPTEAESPENKVIEQDNFASYFASKDVERKALPVANIDSSMLAGEQISGLPISLRLFINAYGKVTKVEQISVMEQDQALAARLEELLFQQVFLPAKKDGIDVDSYQDIQFSF